MANASGVSAAVYGNAAAPAPLQEIHDLRSSVKECCLKGSSSPTTTRLLLWAGAALENCPRGPRYPRTLA
eukprot:4034038-Heterocapsa_arctica.AAC.1